MLRGKYLLEFLFLFFFFLRAISFAHRSGCKLPQFGWAWLSSAFVLLVTSRFCRVTEIMNGKDIALLVFGALAVVGFAYMYWASKKQ